MKKLPKEKRNNLILVILIIAAGIAGIWYGLINFQQQYLENLKERKAAAQEKLKKVELAIRNAAQTETELGSAGRKLADLEDDMGTGDLFSWIVNKQLRPFVATYKVEIPQFSQLEMKDMNLLPKFPYKQATVRVGGKARFHDFGKFLADFENTFPYFRVLNLEMEPTPLTGEADKEKLTFSMDIIALVKPGAS
jgi:hypothetical protein